jgi:hypothetical protein
MLWTRLLVVVVVLAAVALFFASPVLQSPDLATRAITPAARPDRPEGAGAAPITLVPLAIDEDGEHRAAGASAQDSGEGELGLSEEEFVSRSAGPDLDRIMGSFLSERPDLDGLKDLVRDLGSMGKVVEDSLVIDGDTGAVSGLLVFDGLPLTGEFEVSGANFRVGLSSPLPDSDTFMLRTLTVAFDEDMGGVSNGSTVVQHHPNSGAHWGSPGEETYVGWSVMVGEFGTIADPLMMKAAAQGKGGTVGLIGGEAVALEFDWDRSHYAPWLALLASER